jgi:hypothetical protein
MIQEPRRLCNSFSAIAGSTRNLPSRRSRCFRDQGPCGTRPPFDLAVDQLQGFVVSLRFCEKAELKLQGLPVVASAVCNRD